jgi:hypothetical protein
MARRRLGTICALLFAALFALAFISGIARAQPNSSQRDGAESIGVASMEPDGTIVLRLIARGAGGMTGEGLLRYPRSHPQYKEILDHVGPMRPGESRSVAPWPD